MPAGKLACLGVWNDDKFCGSIVYGTGANRNSSKMFNLRHNQTCELVRVALVKGHEFMVSRPLAVSIRMIKKSMPGLKLILSYADTAQGHHGGIYQATNWIYIGAVNQPEFMIKGRRTHKRSLAAKYGRNGNVLAWLKRHIDPSASTVATKNKHRYVMPLDDETSCMIRKIQRPYPKRLKHSDDVLPVQGGEGGLTPT